MTTEDAYRKGYWAGMPARLKSRLYFWTMYYLGLGWLAYLGHWWAFLLIFLPLAWWLFRSWLTDEFLGVDLQGRGGLFDYTLNYLWGASLFTRSFVVVTLLALALGGLGWLGTEDMREEAAKPTLSERATGALAATKETAGDLVEGTKEKAGAATEAVKEKTGGWIETAKGWFD